MKIIIRYFTCEGRFSRLYRYHIRLLMHFTSRKPLNLSNYLCKRQIKMAEKVQNKGVSHSTSLCHHALIKIIFSHQLSQANMSWEALLQSISLPSAASKPSRKSNPSASSKPPEVGSLSRSVEKSPRASTTRASRAEVTKTYKRGKRIQLTPSVRHHEATLHGEEQVHIDFEMAEHEVPIP